MKKIVALALCLIMALSLATVAMATCTSGPNLGAASATANTTAIRKGGIVYNATTKISSQLYYFDVTNAATGVTTYGTVPFVEISNANSADVDLVFIDDNNDVTYYSDDVGTGGKFAGGATVVLTPVTTVVPTVETKDTAACTTKYSNANDSWFKDNTGALYYVTDAGTAFNTIGVVDGVLVGVKAAPAPYVPLNTPGALAPAAGELMRAGHNYVVTYTGTTATAVACADCGKTFKFVQGYEANALKAFGKDNYANTNAGAPLTGSHQVWVCVDDTAAAAAATTTTGVSSAKTFDAGVALYAGMALMSVAGSAVVIGKKKEF